MEALFEAFAAYFSSDIPRNELISHIVLLCAAFVFGIAATILVFKITDRYTTNLISSLKSENKMLKQENHELNIQIKKLNACYQKQIDMDILVIPDEEDELALYK